MKTDVREFDKWLGCLPEFVKSNLWLIPLDGLNKEPAKHVFSTTDIKYAITIEEARERLRNDKNVAVMFSGIEDTLCAFDNDAQKAINTGKPTLMVFTSNGKLHDYYIYDGSFDNGGTTGVSEIGSIRVKNYYTVAPGSYVKPEKDKLHDLTLLNVAGLYTVINQRPVVKINISDLPEGLRRPIDDNDSSEKITNIDNEKSKRSSISEMSINSECVSEKSDGMDKKIKKIKNVNGSKKTVDQNSSIDFKNTLGVNLDSIRKKDSKLELLLSSINVDGYASLSEVDQATISKLVQYNFSDLNIVNIMNTFRYRPKHKKGYFERSIAAARKFLKESDDKSLVVDMRGHRGVLIDDKFFLSIKHSKYDGWSFKLFEIVPYWKELTSWVSVRLPSSLYQSIPAHKIRSYLVDHLTHDGYMDFINNLSMIIQNNKNKWKLSKTQNHSSEEPEFDDSQTNLANNILLHDDPFHLLKSKAKGYHAGDSKLIEFEVVSALSGIITDHPINLWNIGLSGTGKSHSMYTVCLLLPKEVFIIFTSTSPKSFFYYVRDHGEYSLDKKLIFIDETEGSLFTLPTLRSLTSQTPIEPRHLSVHDAKILDLKIRGKRSVWFTSVRTFGDTQIKNRFIHVNPDASPEQDLAVWKLQDLILRQSKKQRKDFGIIKAILGQIIRDTAKLDVVIPFKIKWPFLKRRYLYPLFLISIKVVCKMHYKQRERDEDDDLIAIPQDFEKAKDLWSSFEKTITKRVTGTTADVYEKLPDNMAESLSIEEISREVSVGTKQVRNICEELLDEGLISRTKRKLSDDTRPVWCHWQTEQPKITQIEIDESGEDEFDEIGDEDE